MLLYQLRIIKTQYAVCLAEGNQPLVIFDYLPVFRLFQIAPLETVDPVIRIVAVIVKILGSKAPIGCNCQNCLNV